MDADTIDHQVTTDKDPFDHDRDDHPCDSDTVVVPRGSQKVTTTTISITGTVVYLGEVNHHWFRAKVEEFILDLNRENLRHLHINTDGTTWTGNAIGEKDDEEAHDGP